MITQKMKYALKALLVLADEAEQPKPRPLTIEEIARRSGTPKRFLEHILLEVRNAGVIASIRGRAGGYRLARKPAEISLSDLLRRIDGPIAPLPCLRAAPINAAQTARTRPPAASARSLPRCSGPIC